MEVSRMLYVQVIQLIRFAYAYTAAAILDFDIATPII